MRSFITAPSRSKGGSVSSSLSTVGLQSIDESIEQDVNQTHLSLKEKGGGGTGLPEVDGASCAEGKSVSAVSFASAITVDSFNKKDRDNFVNELMSREQILTLLYAKLFPPSISGPHQHKKREDSGQSGASSVCQNSGGTQRSGDLSTLNSLSAQSLFGEDGDLPGKAYVSLHAEIPSPIAKHGLSHADYRKDMLQNAGQGYTASTSLATTFSPGDSGLFPTPHIQSTDVSATQSRPGTTGLLKYSGSRVNDKDNSLSANKSTCHNLSGRATSSGRK